MKLPIALPRLMKTTQPNELLLFYKCQFISQFTLHSLYSKRSSPVNNSATLNIWHNPQRKPPNSKYIFWSEVIKNSQQCVRMRQIFIQQCIEKIVNWEIGKVGKGGWEEHHPSPLVSHISGHALLVHNSVQCVVTDYLLIILESSKGERYYIRRRRFIHILSQFRQGKDSASMKIDHQSHHDVFDNGSELQLSCLPRLRVVVVFSTPYSSLKHF